MLDLDGGFKIGTMKNLIFLLLSLFSLVSFRSDDLQKILVKKNVIVEGVCGMCKARIEKAAFSEKGVKSASWSSESKQLTLIFDQAKTTLEKVQYSIAEVGHDSPPFIATDEAYEGLPMCCRYKTLEPH